MFLQSNLCVSVSNVDRGGRLEDRAGEEVGHGDVGQKDVIGGAGDIREVLQSDQEQIVEESS